MNFHFARSYLENKNKFASQRLARKASWKAHTKHLAFEASCVNVFLPCVPMLQPPCFASSREATVAAVESVAQQLNILKKIGLVMSSADVSDNRG